jgi:hypothetical protein
MAAAGLPEVVPQDWPRDLPRQTAAIEVVGHQHAAVQQGRQLRCHVWEGRRGGGQSFIDAMHDGIEDGNARVNHRRPLLLELPLGREQQQGNLHDAAELAGPGGLEIHHREATGPWRQQLRQGPGYGRNREGAGWHPIGITAAEPSRSSAGERMRDPHGSRLGRARGFSQEEWSDQAAAL